MRIDLDFPEFHMGVPGNLRTTRMIWLRTPRQVEIPEFASSDLIRAVGYRLGHEQHRREVFRIRDDHYRLAEPSSLLFHHVEPVRRNTLLTDPAILARCALVRHATRWTSKNVAPGSAIYPEDSLCSESNLVQQLPGLPVDGHVRIRDEDTELRRGFESHMDGYSDPLAMIDGRLYEKCRHPFYAVAGYHGFSAIHVVTDESLPIHFVAAFPIGSLAESEEFTELLTLRNQSALSRVTTDIEDCGHAVVSGYEELSLKRAADTLARNVERQFVENAADKDRATMDLLGTFPLEDLSLYRRLAATRDRPDTDPDAIAGLLTEAASSPSGDVFTSGGRFPLEMVCDLWDNRPVATPIGERAGPGP